MTRGLPYILAFLLAPIAALPAQLGDLDGDGVATVRDLAILVGHKNETRTLPAAQAVLADVNGDGAVNQADADEVVFEILGTRTPQELPSAHLRQTSPSDGEGDVALTRETILHFSLPLNLGASISTNHFFAEFGGKRILSRAELSSDRKKATLFYLQPLPSSARVNVWFDGTGLTDLLGRPLDADGDGVTGGVARVQFDTLSITPVAQTGIRGRVFASERATGGLEVPLAGVTVTVDGAEETLRTTTDAQGNFTLSPCPAGSFFVHVDGRTSPQSSYPGGNYYPSVGKRWQAEPGRTDNLAGNEQDVTRGDIYLPLIKAGTLAATSPTEDVTITNPDLPGAYLVVPANSLFSDDGARGGSVGMAPVAPDRIPSPLPPGLNLPLVVTIQTNGGQNFDRPVPLCLPNLPDPVTGEKLPPGAASALWSFNHDLGDWEVVGPMTVTADGEFVKTDVGVGVRQPGWHGTFPGTESTGPDSLLGSSGGGGGGGSCCTPPPPPPPDDPCGPNFTPPKNSEEATKSRVGLIQNTAMSALSHLAELSATGISAARNIFKYLDGRRINNLTGALGDIIDGINPFKEIGILINRSRTLNQYYFDSKIAFETGSPQPDPCRNAGVSALPIQNNPPTNKLQTPAIQESANDPDDQLLQIERDLAELLEKLQQHLIEQNKIANLFADKPVEYAPTEQERQEIYETMERIRIMTDGESAKDYYFSKIFRIFDNLDLASENSNEQGNRSGNFMIIQKRNSNVVARGKTTTQGRIPRVILAANTEYKALLYFSDKKSVSESHFISARPGSPTTIPFFGLPSSDGFGVDSDDDGLTILAENIFGTDDQKPDTDDDGIDDLAETINGSNPLHGLIANTGVIASAPTSGPAVDISAVNNIAAVACETKGVTVFNVFSGLNPVRIAEIPVTGSAIAVSCAGNYVAAACLFGGLAVIDIADPRNPRLLHQINLGASAQAVVTDGLVAFVGLDNGQVASVDLPTGKVLYRTSIGSMGVHDLAMGQSHLYILKADGLYTISVTGASFGASTQATFAGNQGAGGRRLRLFFAENILYAVHTAGYQIFSLANPAFPSSLRDQRDGQFGWKNLAANGSGLGIAAVDANSTADGAHDVSLYDLGPSGTNSTFITRFATPGLASSVSLYNGLAYVADGQSGLQVVSYRPYDSLGIPPTIALGSNINLNHTTHAGIVEEGKAVRLYATVTDDVQVRNVEFYVNSALATTDGNFPFEHRFVTPAISPSNTSITVRARATDTGGNATWTEPYTVNLIPDSTPPVVTAVSPANGAYVGSISNLYVTFSEPIDPYSLSGGLQVLGINGTANPPSGLVSYRENLRAAFLDFSTPLPPGQYQILVQAPLADAAGNAIASTLTSAFRVYSFTDNDSDGVPDEMELQLGLSFGENDSDNDGILDGDEDFDLDGLPNRGEFALRRDPLSLDSDGNGILDGNEDGDFDGLNDGGEIRAGTDPANPDSDGDGLDDATEISAGLNPLATTSLRATLASPAIGYLNVLPAFLPGGTEILHISQPVSYRNQ